MSGAIERIVVQLDAASENRQAIETAARLAACARVPLHAVFVEDEELLALAGLPFARQATFGFGGAAFTTAGAALHLRAAAERARREIEAAARRHGITSSFAVARGGADIAAPALSKRHLVVAGAVTRAVAGQFRVEWRSWAAVENTGGSLLLVRRAAETNGAIAVLLRDRDAAASRLLAAAAHVAQAHDGELLIIAPAAVAETEGFRGWLDDRAAGVPLRVEIAPDEPDELHRRIGEFGVSLLAVDAGVVGSGGRLRQFVERFTCDILVVR